ncbi:MAG TPA: hypothetical protein VLC48_03840 [Gemmatimonadota bacterium]|nr:hypothetical protein [Gemmatimonadota bacterium]
MTRFPVRTIKVLSVAICLASLPSCGGDSTGPTEDSPFEGEWAFDISGDAVGGGSCVIQSNGSFSINLDFTVGGSVYPQVIAGSVRNSGDLTATIRYAGNSIGSISGRLTGDTGSGTWQTSLAGTGTWTAARGNPNTALDRPVIVGINFPALISAAPGMNDGTVEFSDRNADITHAYFDLVSTTGSSFTPFDFDPDVLGQSSGTFDFNLGCLGPEDCSGTTVLSVTLEDAEGHSSEPVQFSFTYQ